MSGCAMRHLAPLGGGKYAGNDELNVHANLVMVRGARVGWLPGSGR